MKFRKNAGDVSNAQNKIQLFPILLINFIGTLGFSIVYASTIIEDRTTVSGAIYTSRAIGEIALIMTTEKQTIFKETNPWINIDQ